MKTPKFFLLPLAGIMLAAGAASAQTVASGTTGSCTWALTGAANSLTLTISGTGNMARYGSLLDVPWYSYRIGIKALSIGQGVTSIGSEAFDGCSGLTSVSIPTSVTSIGGRAFYGCSGLTSVSIPTSVTSIGSGAFSDCSGLTAITVDAADTSYSSENGVLFNKNKTTLICCPAGKTGSYTIPPSVTSIGSYAFSGCSGLTAVNIPEGVTSIYERAFSGCSGLTSVSIPSSVKRIYYYAFYGCSGLTSVSIPPSVTSIYDYAFYGCSGLTSVSIPTSVTSIGSSAFYGCSGLTSVSIPPSVTSIGNSAFYGCSGLKSVTNLSVAPQSINSNVFSGVTVGNIALTVPTSSVAAYRNAAVWKNFKSVVGGGVLLSVQATPGALGSVAGTASGLHPADTSVSLTATPTEGYSLLGWTSGSNSLGSALTLSFSLARDTVITAHFGKVGSYSVSPNGLKNVTDIKMVTHLTLTGSIDARDVKFMRDSMPYLKELDLSDATIAAYSGTEGTYSSNRSYPANEMPDYSFDWSITGSIITLTSVKLPGSITAIGGWAFNGCSGLASVTIPASVTSIGSSAFDNCSGLTSVAIPASVTSIGSSAFYNCSGLTSVNIPASVTSIGNSAFVYCSGLTSVSIPASLTSIGSSAFYGCSGLTSVAIPASVTSIGEWAFSGCSGLTAVTIPALVTSIGERAFNGCSGLISVTNLATTPQSITSNSNVFYQVNTANCTLRVPLSSVSAYQSANVWKDFKIQGVATYTLTFNAQGGTVSPANITVVNSAVVGTLPTPMRSGYTFGGWYTEQSGKGTLYTEATVYSATSNTTLHAKWVTGVAATYMLTFNAQSGTVSPVSKTVASGVAVGALPVPTRSGYGFGGWYTGQNGAGTLYTESTVYSAAGNTTLYAKWVVPYTITFNAQSGTVSPGSKIVLPGAVVGALPVPTRSGYVFTGWYTGTNGAGTRYTDSTAYSATSNTTLYAKWAVAYTLTFNAQGGTVAPGSKIVASNEVVGALPVPVRDGYGFGGWYTGIDGTGMRYTESAVYSPTSNTTLYAKWVVPYTLSFDAQGGTVNPSSQIALPGEAVGALPTPTRSGYTFGGWYTETNGAGTRYTESTVYNILGNTTLYAKWTENTYTLTFDAQSGTVAPASKSIASGEAVGALPTPTRSGYTFGGWYTAPNGAGTRYTEVTLYNILGNTTLYAKWTAGSTGVSAQLQANINLYPNPFTAEVRLTGAAGCTLTVITVAGAAVHTQTVGSAEETVKLEQLPSGVYFFRLEKDGKSYTVKGYKR
ncbi:MAG: leucine-rich repeat protein [Prevotellaceae bacterium]|jgi:uncharacterized repeat protein (TIGR02543 family)|nr:leucine-rich repeat protein [Prevotellaceae bacterium]